MKKNKVSFLFLIFGLIFVMFGVGLYFSTQGSGNDNSNESNNNDSDNKPVVKELRKITLEELNDETAMEIVQYYVELDSTSEDKILSSKIIAGNEKGKYLVRLEILDDDSKDTTITYLGDGKWEVSLPLEYSGIIGDEFTEFYDVLGE